MAGSRSMVEAIHVLQETGIVGLGGPYHAAIQLVSRVPDGKILGTYQLVGAFPLAYMRLPGYGGFRTLHAAERALAIFEAGGTYAEALGGAMQAPHPKEEHNAI